MFTGEQTFVRFFRTGQRISQQAGGFGLWLLIVPGLILILFGVAILLWPSYWPIWWRVSSLRSASASPVGVGVSSGDSATPQPTGNLSISMTTTSFSSR